MKSFKILPLIGFGIFSGYSIYEGNQKFYEQILMPLSRIFPAEESHRIAVFLAKHNFYPQYDNKHLELKNKVFGLDFSHPVGMAAGFDKDGEAVLGLLKAGFSHVEVGSVTPKPQYGNPKPRVFRYPKVEAVINRYGFNSCGHDIVYERLKSRNWKGKGIVGVNLGVNKTSVNPSDDYVQGVNKFGEIADYLVINVSSPNTPGLRNLQKRSELQKMLKPVVEAKNKLPCKTPLLLKISPDESDEDLKNICEVVLNPESRIDGLIVSNTTVSRDPNVLGESNLELLKETGGLSGKPLNKLSTECIRKVHQFTKGSIPIIGVGGISSADDVRDKLRAGASLVQLYTAMVYKGPPVVKTIVEDLAYNEAVNKETIDKILIKQPII